MGFLSSLTGSSIGKATTKALGENKGLIQGFQTTGNNIINTGEQNSGDALRTAISAYQPWYDTGGDANTMYSNALGLNGEGGNAAATGAFQTNPGYEFARGEAERAGLRAASAGGMLASGNTLAALSDRSQGLADQEYGSWLDRLNGMSQQGLQAASGQAAGYTGLADLYQNTASDRLGLESSTTQGLIGNNNDLAKVQEQRAANKGGFFGGLLKTGLSLGTKALTGGLM